MVFRVDKIVEKPVHSHRKAKSNAWVCRYCGDELPPGPAPGPMGPCPEAPEEPTPSAKKPDPIAKIAQGEASAFVADYCDSGRDEDGFGLAETAKALEPYILAAIKKATAPLEAENERLREALEPFAQEYRNRQQWVPEMDNTDGEANYKPSMMKYKHFQRAAALANERG